MTSDYWLKLYKHPGFEELLAEYAFSGQEEFVKWGRGVDDEISSFEFKIPEGWALYLFRDPDPGASPYQAWLGTGEVESVDAGEMGALDDEASAHKWAKFRVESA